MVVDPSLGYFFLLTPPPVSFPHNSPSQKSFSHVGKFNQLFSAIGSPSFFSCSPPPNSNWRPPFRRNSCHSCTICSPPPNFRFYSVYKTTGDFRVIFERVHWLRSDAACSGVPGEGAVVTFRRREFFSL